MSTAAGSSTTNEVDDPRRRCGEFPWHNVLRICSGVAFIGIWISAFFCFTACNGGTPQFRDYLLSIYVLFFGLLGIAAELQIGMTFIFRKLPWLARFNYRGLYSFFVASIALGGEFWQILTSAVLMMTAILHPLYYFLFRNKARGIERKLLPWLYLTDALGTASDALEAGKARASQALARGQTAAASAQQQGQVYAAQAQQQGQAYATQTQQRAQAASQQFQGYGTAPAAGAPPPPPPAI
eukprot:ANDGO_00256.mRNA.1 hypothetical protein